MRRPRFTRRRLLLAVAVLVVPAAAAIATYVWAGTNAIVHGLDGCSYVRDAAARGTCIEREIRAELDGVSLARGLARVNELALADPLIASRCHLALHPAGERHGVETANRDAPLETVPDETVCDRGFIHGAVIGYSEATDRPLADIVPDLCRAEQQTGPACAHAVGHMLVRADADTAADAGRAIARDCRSDSELVRASASVSSDRADDAYVDECRRGGYMELALGQGQPQLHAWAAGCGDDTPIELAAYCYAWLPPLASWHDVPVAEATRFCDDEDLSRSRAEACIRGVAVVATSAVECNDFHTGRSRRACGAMLAAAPS